MTAPSKQALLKAVEIGDTATMAACIDAGVSVESRDVGGDTALGNAAFNGQTMAAELLLACGANANASNSDGGDTPLMWAAVGGHYAICCHLLKAGANVNAQNEKGFTALYRATYKDHPTVVRCLLAAAADPCMKTSFGKSALHCARENGFEEVAQALRAVEVGDAVYIEAIKRENPQAASNFVTLPSPAALLNRKG